MRTFKLLLPLIINLVFVVWYVPFSFYEMELKLSFDSDVALYIDGHIGLNFGIGFCSAMLLIILFYVTLVWLVINAIKYLSDDIRGRYIFLGAVASFIINGTTMIYFYNNYLSGLPDALYYILELWRFF